MSLSSSASTQRTPNLSLSLSLAMPHMRAMGDIDVYTTVLAAMSATTVREEKLNGGGRVLLPTVCLDDISRLSMVYPLQFMITSKKHKKCVYAGVLEFTAERGTVVMPDWMVEHLGIKDKTIVSLKTCSLSGANIIKLQPHTQEFLALTDPRTVLEQHLANYTALTKGAAIVIRHAKRDFRISITELLDSQQRPVDAVLSARADTMATEVKVEFERPRDMPPDDEDASPLSAPSTDASTSSPTGIAFSPAPFKPPTIGSSTAPPPPSEAPTQPTFVPFTGGGQKISSTTAPQMTPEQPPAHPFSITTDSLSRAQHYPLFYSTQHLEPVTAQRPARVEQRRRVARQLAMGVSTGVVIGAASSQAAPIDGARHRTTFFFHSDVLCHTHAGISKYNVGLKTKFTKFFLFFLMIIFSLICRTSGCVLQGPVAALPFPYAGRPRFHERCALTGAPVPLSHRSAHTLPPSRSTHFVPRHSTHLLIVACSASDGFRAAERAYIDSSNNNFCSTSTPPPSLPLDYALRILQRIHWQPVTAQRPARVEQRRRVARQLAMGVSTGVVIGAAVPNQAKQLLSTGPGTELPFFFHSDVLCHTHAGISKYNVGLKTKFTKFFLFFLMIIFSLICPLRLDRSSCSSAGLLPPAPRLTIPKKVPLSHRSAHTLPPSRSTHFVPRLSTHLLIVACSASDGFRAAERAYIDSSNNNFCSTSTPPPSLPLDYALRILQRIHWFPVTAQRPARVEQRRRVARQLAMGVSTGVVIGAASSQAAPIDGARHRTTFFFHSDVLCHTHAGISKYNVGLKTKFTKFFLFFLMIIFSLICRTSGCVLQGPVAARPFPYAGRPRFHERCALTGAPVAAPASSPLHGSQSLKGAFIAQERTHPPPISQHTFRSAPLHPSSHRGVLGLRWVPRCVKVEVNARFCFVLGYFLLRRGNNNFCSTSTPPPSLPLDYALRILQRIHWFPVTAQRPARVEQRRRVARQLAMGVSTGVVIGAASSQAAPIDGARHRTTFFFHSDVLCHTHAGISKYNVGLKTKFTKFFLFFLMIIFSLICRTSGCVLQGPVAARPFPYAGRPRFHERCALTGAPERTHPPPISQHTFRSAPLHPSSHRGVLGLRWVPRCVKVEVNARFFFLFWGTFFYVAGVPTRERAYIDSSNNNFCSTSTPPPSLPLDYALRILQRIHWFPVTAQRPARVEQRRRVARQLAMGVSTGVAIGAALPTNGAAQIYIDVSVAICYGDKILLTYVISTVLQQPVTAQRPARVEQRRRVARQLAMGVSTGVVIGHKTKFTKFFLFFLMIIFSLICRTSPAISIRWAAPLPSALRLDRSSCSSAGLLPPAPRLTIPKKVPSSHRSAHTLPPISQHTFRSAPLHPSSHRGVLGLRWVPRCVKVEVNVRFFCFVLGYFLLRRGNNNFCSTSTPPPSLPLDYALRILQRIHWFPVTAQRPARVEQRRRVARQLAMGVSTGVVIGAAVPK
eukprot:gene6642-4761_t